MFQPVWVLHAVVSMWSPSSTWVGVLVSTEYLRGMPQGLTTCIPSGGAQTVR